MIFDKLLLVVASFFLGYMWCYIGKYTDLRHHYEQLESMVGGGDFDKCN